MPWAHRVTVDLGVEVGSRFETPHSNGLSHFLEHMLFRGVPSAPSSHAQALAFEGLGGTLYAATHVDRGVLSLTIPPDCLSEVLRLLGEVVTRPLFTSPEVERRIVREEILEDRDDDGREIDADNLCRALLYPGHPLGYSITGEPDALDRFDEPTLRSHLAAHYTTEASVLTLAGRLPPLDVVISLAEQSFGELPQRPCSVAAAAPPLRARGQASFRYVESDSSQTELRLAYRAVSRGHALEPAVDLLLRVLDDGMSTRLYSRICDTLGLCYDVWASFEPYHDDGVFDLGASSTHERAPEVAREMLGILDRLASEGPTIAELDKARRRHAWATQAMRDSADDAAEFFGAEASAMSTRTALRTPEERHAELAAVTRDEVRQAAEHLFRPERLAVVAVGVLDSRTRKELERAVRGR
jgi:predicted Zn-dependent peptidase